jgi:hypothetical protein
MTLLRMGHVVVGAQAADGPAACANIGIAHLFDTIMGASGGHWSSR